MQNEINAAKRVVIKVGSSLLIRDGALDKQWLTGLAEEIKTASARGQQQTFFELQNTITRVYLTFSR